MRRVAAIIQARLSSSRLPGKMMMNVSGETLLEQTLQRAIAIPDVDAVVLATSTTKEDEKLLEVAIRVGVVAFRQ